MRSENYLNIFSQQPGNDSGPIDCALVRQCHGYLKEEQRPPAYHLERPSMSERHDLRKHEFESLTMMQSHLRNK